MTPTSPPRRRFDPVTIIVHWYLAFAIVTLIVTGTVLIVPALAIHVPRALVNRIHIDAGLSGAGVLLLGLVGPWGRGLRNELRSLMVAPAELVSERAGGLLRRLGGTRARVRALNPDRFNLGQRVFAAVMAGLLTLALLTGLALRTPGRLPLWLQAGCQLTHELAWLAITLGVVGHIAKVLQFRVLQRGH